MSGLLSDVQSSMLRDILNKIIPGNHGMPGAGLIVTSFIELEAERSSVAKRIVVDMLAVTDAAARSHHKKSFLGISDSSKESLLKIVEGQNQQLFNDFVNLVYDGYYTNSAVINLLGADAAMPQPIGFSNPPFDPHIVDKVRTLGPKYRAIYPWNR